jgi:hypothetical protein
MRGELVSMVGRGSGEALEGVDAVDANARRILAVKPSDRVGQRLNCLALAGVPPVVHNALVGAKLDPGENQASQDPSAGDDQKTDERGGWSDRPRRSPGSEVSLTPIHLILLCC